MEEAEYGLYYLGNFQCAPPMWPSAALYEQGYMGPQRGQGAQGVRRGRSEMGQGVGSNPALAVSRPRSSPQVVISAPGEAAEQGRVLTSLAAASGQGRKPLKERMEEIDTQVQSSLDAFFANERCWNKVSVEVRRTMNARAVSIARRVPAPGKKASFRVQVPKPYPGVQYRKTKDINDKFPRFAKHGATVVGEVEDMDWVKVRKDELLFLPLRIGPVQFLEPLLDPVPISNVIGADDQVLIDAHNKGVEVKVVHDSSARDKGFCLCTVPVEGVPLELPEMEEQSPETDPKPRRPGPPSRNESIGLC